jgi:hypothetical protein
MQEIEVPPRDSFKYYVQVEGAPKTIMWNFSTKRKNISFGLYYQFEEHGSNGNTSQGLSSSTSSPHNGATASPKVEGHVRNTSDNSSKSVGSPPASRRRLKFGHSEKSSSPTDHNADSNSSPEGPSSAVSSKSNAFSVKGRSLLNRDGYLEEVVPVRRYESCKATIKGQKTVTKNGVYVLLFGTYKQDFIFGALWWTRSLMYAMFPILILNFLDSHSIDNTFSRNTSKKMTFFVAMRDGGKFSSKDYKIWVFSFL